MKKFSFLISLIFIVCLSLVAVALGADAVAVVAPAVTAPVPTVSFILWAQQNLSVILGICLTLSELMGASPWFKGNGIIHSITVSLQYLMQKPTA